MSNLLNKLINGQSIVMDGATGTNLFDKGLVSGDAPELWNADYPERIFELNASFVNAGSDVVLTNSFGGNAMRLKLHQSEHRVNELNEKAAQIARRAVEKVEREVLVAGSIGPLGELLAPLGTIEYEEAIEVFASQAIALERGGCNILWVETMSAIEEIQAVIEGISRTNLPFSICASFDTNGRTMMGVKPSELVDLCLSVDHKPVAIGSNCGVGPAQTVAAILEMAVHSSGSIPLIAKANCGVPEWVGTEIVYSATPDQMYVYAQIVRDAGASIIGGCCGTQPIHIKKICKALDGYVSKSQPTLAEVEFKLGEVFQSSKKEGRKRRRSTRS